MEVTACRTPAARRALTWARLGRQMLASTVVFVLGVALLLIARRVAGATQQPLAPLTLWLMTLIMGVGGLLLALTRRPASDQKIGVLLSWGGVLSAALLSAAVSVPGSSGWALTGLWLVVLTQAAWLLWWTQGRGATPSVTGNEIRSPLPERSKGCFAHETPDPFCQDDAVDFPADVEQQLVRATDPQVGVIIHGRLRAAFEAGQRTTSLHVAFCPPLSERPSVSVEPLTGPTATAKVGVALLQGARIDVRLDEIPATATDVVLAFHAQEHIVNSDRD